MVTALHKLQIYNACLKSACIMNNSRALELYTHIVRYASTVTGVLQRTQMQTPVRYNVQVQHRACCIVDCTVAVMVM
jgi:hypothetical protein